MASPHRSRVDVRNRVWHHLSRVSAMVLLLNHYLGEKHKRQWQLHEATDACYVWMGLYMFKAASAMLSPACG